MSETSTANDRTDVSPVADDGDGERRLALDLGSKLRALRLGQKLTLQKLAEAVGVSPSLISQVERGEASPSMTTLRRLAVALGVPTAALFLDSLEATRSDDAGERGLVVRRSGRKKMHAARSRVEYELLTPDINRQVEFILGEFEPGASAPPEPATFVAHAGEENILVLSGSVAFTIGTSTYALDTGDSISFDCSIPHRLENIGDEKLSIVIVITPPTF